MYFWKVCLGEIWEGLSLISYWKLEVSVSSRALKSRFTNKKIQFTAQLKLWTQLTLVA